ncbi:unnamed protein product, partial [Mesorhabditis spiculigera]
MPYWNRIIILFVLAIRTNATNCSRTLDSDTCPIEKLALPSKVVVEVGEDLILEAHPPRDASFDFDFNPFFRYVHSPGPPYTETHNGSTIRLFAGEPSLSHMGIIAFYCWTCQQPLVRFVTVFVKSNLSVFIQDEMNQHSIYIHGWPLDNLTVALIDVDVEWDDEKHILGNDTIRFRNGSLLMKHIHSTFYLRHYDMYTRQCSHCEHDLPRGNFSLRFCTSTQCDQVTTRVAHVADIRPKVKGGVLSGSFPAWPFLLLIPFVIVIGCCCCIRSNYWTKPYFFPVFQTGAKAVDQRNDKFRLRSKFAGVSKMWRRTSRATEATEETNLRMEERGSLCVSDYTGHLIPVISLGNIQIKEKIGQGAFGEVYRALWTASNDREVAVKTINLADSETEKEAQVLSKLDHPNIVRLFGMTRDGGKMLLIFEMMNLGDLKSYLKARKPLCSNYAQFPPPLESSELLFITRQIVRGLCYLNSQQIVHRDLAARNCLVSGADDTKICDPTKRAPFCVKISDFGMSRRLYSQSEYYKMQTAGAMLPVRWLPPESLNSCRFSHHSDIWALGVTMWEIFTYGETPFADLENNEVVAIGLSGVKPARPPRCPVEIYQLMEKCWVLNPEQRISAEDAMLEPCLQASPSRPRPPLRHIDPLSFEVDVPDDIAPLINGSNC